MPDWKLGDEPESHPLWERQVELEMQMVERGAERYRTRLAKAIEKQEMTAMRPWRRILEDMVEVMSKGLEHWVKATEKTTRGAARPIAWHMAKDLDPKVIAFITARTVLDTVSIQNKLLSTVARAIGQEIEQEARMQAWLKRDPKLFYKVEHDLDSQRATTQHRRRVNINRFNKLIKVKARWRDWTSDEKIHTGLKMLEVLEVTTGHIQRIKDPSFVRTSKFVAPYVVVPSEELLQYLQDTSAQDQARMPLYLPTLMPPKRWEGVRRGGYYTPTVRIPKLIRFKADNQEVQGIATDEYDSLDMPEVFAALNRVQEVPWRVNKRVLEVALEAWDRNIGIGKLIKREQVVINARGQHVPAELPGAPEGMRRPDIQDPHARRKAEAEWQKAHPKLFAKWKHAAAKRYGEVARSVSHLRSVDATMRIAEQFMDEEFYFPHILDFRGRMYPIPAYLQPQGNDLARGLLTFAQGRPVGPGGDDWLAIHLANCWGNDKVSYEERITWARENWDLWVRIHEAPLRNLEWSQADDPWQALAAILEFVRVCSSDNIEGMVSALPIRVDGTCNGIQHLSALMRDEVGGASVNLLPSNRPRDIYGEVGEILYERLVGIRDSGGPEGEWAARWLKVFGDSVPRKFCKGPVMVTPYGGTRDSFKGSVLEWLRDNNPKAIPDKKGKKYGLRFEATVWIVPHLWDAVGERTGRGKECMEWLKTCAGKVAATDQPVWWTTPTGFHVRHFYGRLQKRIIATKVDGRRVQLVEQVRSKKLSKKDQLQGIAPNYVHSLDASVNMETILAYVVGEDPPPFTTIHDAFGTVAGGMWPLFGCIREAFIKVHKNDVMGDFRTRCTLMLRDHLMAINDKDWSQEDCWAEADAKMPGVPAKGGLDIQEVRRADYFFA